MTDKAGYNSASLLAFIRSRGTHRESDDRLEALNDIRLSDGHREMLARWATWDTVPLDKVDRFFMKYDLMTYELEDWAGAEVFIAA